MEVARYGIIGTSKGNGHPYSWAAICNGYDSNYLNCCEYNTIKKYLSEKKYPEDFISTIKIDYIWTQDNNISVQIAKFSKIKYVVQDLNDMLGNVAGVLIARDDADTHLEFALPFLKAGLPVFVDKPLCLRVSDIKSFYEAARSPSQIFSCSALKYSDELKLTMDDTTYLGALNKISCTVPSLWETYSIHAIDAVLPYLPDDESFASSHVKTNVFGGKTVTVIYPNGFQLDIDSCVSSLPITVSFYGEKGRSVVKEFNNSFDAFKKSLQEFQLLTSRPDYNAELELHKSIQLVELGL